jgi:hypothetical protein
MERVRRDMPDAVCTQLEIALCDYNKSFCTPTLPLEGHTFSEVSRHNQTPNLPKLQADVDTDCGVKLSPPPRRQRRYLDLSSSNALTINLTDREYHLIKDEEGELRLTKKGKGRALLNYFSKIRWKAKVSAGLAELEIGTDESLSRFAR